MNEKSNLTRRRVVAVIGTAIPCAISAPVIAQENTSELARLIEKERMAEAAFYAAAAAYDPIEVRVMQWKKRTPLRHFQLPLGLSIDACATSRGDGLNRIDSMMSIGSSLSRTKGQDPTTPKWQSFAAAHEAAKVRWNAVQDKIDAKLETLGFIVAERQLNAACVALTAARIAVLSYPACTSAEVDLKASWMKDTFSPNRPSGRNLFEQDYADALLASFVGRENPPA